MNRSRPATVVLGLGNPLMGDDGAGLAALAALRDGWRVGEGTELVDGGTWGMNLLPAIEGASRLVLLDAMDTRSLPGTLTVLEREQLPRVFAHKLSPHQVDLREVLALAELRGALPANLVAIGVQPASVELRDGLSPEVAAAIPKMVRTAVGVLLEAGIRCERVAEPVDA